MPIETNMTIDIATIYADELKKVGITLNVKPVQFQKMVDSLTKGYDWQSIMISLGSNYFPVQGTTSGSHTGISTCGTPSSPSRQRRGRQRWMSCTGRASRSGTL